MNDYFPQVSENEGVYPMEINNTGAQDHSIDRLICAGPAHSPRPPHYRDERFIQGQQQIGLGNCAICLNAPNNGFLISYAQDLPTCGHLVCSTCAVEILTKGARICPFCRRYIQRYIRVDFP